MRTSWCLVAVIAVYILLDLSLPAMPGAFVFDPDDSVESAHPSRDRGDVVVARARAPMPTSLAVVDDTLAVVPDRAVPSRPIRWSPRRAPTEIPEPASSSEDSH